jgi:hypothetical protein
MASVPPQRQIVILRSEATKNLRLQLRKGRSRHRRDSLPPVAQNDKIGEFSL